MSSSLVESKRDIQQFDQNIRSLFDVSVKILEEKTKRSSSNMTNPLLRSLRRYISVYTITDKEMHFTYFDDLFHSHADDFLNFFEDEYWLSKQDLSIRCGQESNDPQIIERSEKRKFNLSEIYSIACQIRENSIESLKGLPQQEHENPEMKYPDFFLLYLYRIFELCATDENDKQELREIIHVLEEDCGITIAGQQVPKHNNPLEGILGMAKNLFSGLNGSTGTNIDTTTIFPDISKTIGTVFQHENIKKLTEEMAPAVQGENVAESMGKFFNLIQNPDFIDKALKNIISAVPAETMDTLTKSAQVISEQGQDLLQNQIIPQLQGSNIQEALQGLNIQQTLTNLQQPGGLQDMIQTLTAKQDLEQNLLEQQ